MTKKFGKCEIEVTVTLLTDMEQVLLVYPYAICKREPLKPWTRRSGLYVVRMEPRGPTIAVGRSTALAWAAAFRELKDSGQAPPSER